MHSNLRLFILLILGFLFQQNGLQAQDETVGLLAFEPGRSPGYTLFAPNSSRNTYLIDNCGYLIHEWENENFPELSVYLLEDGSLLKAMPGAIEKRSWDGELLWLYDLEVHGWNHHDIEPLPNGNVLVIITEEFSGNEAIANGRNPDSLDDEFGVDAIFEIQQTGLESGEVVWKWSFWDHLIQDFDPSKENYGELADHPRRLDINYNDLGEPWDWLHCNGIDYNAELDQIIISSRHTSELYIIDHSTTTQEAASSTGGDAGFGGDFLWRWGNNKVFDKGTFADQKLYQQHNGTWVPEGYPHAGKITVFNNLANFDFNGEPYSEIAIVDPVMLSDNSYSLHPDGTFGAPDFLWTYTGTVLNENFWSEIESGTNMLPNGNFLSSLAVGGRFVEITSEGQVVWVYQNPISFDPVDQYDPLIGFFDVFRAERYPLDYPGFDGKNLSQKGVLEGVNPISELCNVSASTTSTDKSTVEVWPNPVYDHLIIDLLDSKSIQAVHIYTANGQLMESSIYTDQVDNQLKIEGLNTLPPGLYFIEIHQNERTTTGKFVKF